MIKVISKTLVVVLLFSTAVILIAEAALPGDLLYRLKTDINEPVKSWLTNNDSQAAYEIGLLNERLSEIDQLVASGKLSGKAASIAKQQVASQLQTATAAVTASAASNMSPSERAAFVAALEEIKQSLLVHQENLNQLVAADTVAPSDQTIDASTIDLADVTDSFSGMLDELTDAAGVGDDAVSAATDAVLSDTEMASSTASSTFDTINVSIDQETTNESAAVTREATSSAGVLP